MPVTFRPMFETNRTRIDPYRSFKFIVKWDNEAVAGLSKMSALKWANEAIEWREAADPSVVRKLPGYTKYEPVTLEAGVSRSTKFLEWASLIHTLEGDAAVSLKNFRKELTIDVLNLQGDVVMSFTLRRAWVSEFQALPEMDANANAVAITTLRIEHEGFVIEEVPEKAER